VKGRGREHHEKVAAFWKDKLLELRRDRGHLLAEEAVVLASAPAGGFSETMNFRAACPKCHRGYTIHIDAEGGVSSVPDT
jgi:hypothetical protein